MNKFKIIKIISIILALSLIYFIINRFLIHTPTQKNTVKYSRKPVIENFSDADDMKELIEFSQQQNEQNKDNDNQEKSVIFLERIVIASISAGNVFVFSNNDKNLI